MPFPHKRTRIETTVRKWLAEGKYKNGDRFPSDLDLSRRFKVTHVTVRGALQPLVDAGILERHVGQGTVVRGLGAAAAPRSLAGAVGVAIPDNTLSFFGEILRGIESELFSTNRPLLLAHTEEMADREDLAVERWLDQGLSHLILVPTATRPTFYRKLLAAGVRLVFVDRDVSGVDVPSVRSRDVEGCARLTTHLLGLGHRRIYHLAGPDHASTARARVEGFRRAMQNTAGDAMEGYIVPTGFSADDGYRAVLGLLATRGTPDAIVACNDTAAAGALRALAEAKLAVPGDVSLVGYGDTDMAISLDLTTVRQFPERMGREAVRLLMGDQALTAAQSIEIDSEVVVRASTATRR